MKKKSILKKVLLWIFGIFAVIFIIGSFGTSDEDAKKIESLTKEVDSLKSNNQKLKERNKDLQKYENSKKKLEEQEKQIESLKEELKGEKEDVKKLNEERENLEQEKNKLEKENEQISKEKEEHVCPSPSSDNISSNHSSSNSNNSSTGPVRANSKSKIYHVPGGQFYEEMRDSEDLVIFNSPEEAKAAGYRPSKR